MINVWWNFNFFLLYFFLWTFGWSCIVVFCFVLCLCFWFVFVLWFALLLPGEETNKECNSSSLRQQNIINNEKHYKQTYFFSVPPLVFWVGAGGVRGLFNADFKGFEFVEFGVGETIGVFVFVGVCLFFEGVTIVTDFFVFCFSCSSSWSKNRNSNRKSLNDKIWKVFFF